MKGSDIAGILNFTSFLPEPDAPDAAWRRRFPNRKTVLFGLGKQSVTVHPVSRSGKISTLDPIAEIKDFKESLSALTPQIKELTDAGWCAISLHTRYVISLETNLSRRPGSEEIVKTNPRTVLGGRYERGKRYSLTHNPETNSSILLTVDEEQTRKVETLFKDTGFKIGRICCGAYALLSHALSVINTSKGSEKPASAFIIVLCEGAVCALVQDHDRWLELRSRTDVYDTDMAAAFDLVAPFQARIPREMPIVIAADTVIPGLAEHVGGIFEGHEVRDITEPNLLWNLIVHN